jgi:hypothetical protein
VSDASSVQKGRIERAFEKAGDGVVFEYVSRHGVHVLFVCRDEKELEDRIIVYRLMST